MYTEISLQDLKNRRIPPFFADWWKANQQEMKQYLTKHDYDPVADFASEGNLAIGTGMLLSMGGMIVLGFAAVVQTSHHFQDSYWNLYVSEHWFVACWILALAALVWTFRWLSKLTPEEERNGHKFVRSLERLYCLFDIKVDEDIASLSYEEFRACIEGILSSRGRLVDVALNFERIEWRKEFVEMHKAALVFGLCHESYEHYFPKKDK